MKIHTTIGLYPDLSYKINGVREDLLKQHIKYNITNRFGRALFLDGKCIYKGIGFTPEILKIHEQLFKNSKYIITKDTAPYE